MKPFVYALIDPADPGHVRYVGMSSTNLTRPYDHARRARMNSSGHTHIINWVRKIQREGRNYVVLILEELPEGSSSKFLGFVESCYIKSLREIGHRLVNGTAGGDGLTDPTPEVRKKISNALKGNTNALGYEHPDDARASMSDSMLGNTNALGVVRSDDFRNRVSNTLKGHFVSEETREKIRQKNLGYVHSEESRVKRSISLKAAWARRKGAK